MPPLVTAQETSDLLSLLSAPDQTFEDLTRRFKEAWPARSSRQLSALLAVLLFLQEGAIKQPVQRFAALHLLHSLSRQQKQGKNLFAPFLVQAIQDPDRPLQERLFIQLLLVEGRAPEGTVSDALRTVEQTQLQPILPPEEFRRIFQRRDSERAARVKQLEEDASQEDCSKRVIEAIVRDGAQEDILPPFIRPKPPMLPLQPGELTWLHPQLPHLIHWDKSLGNDESSVVELQQLLRQALEGPLLPMQQQQVLSALEADGKLVLSLNLSPTALPDLVEHNPAIAIEILLRLINLGHGTEQLPALVNMEMSLHSMEVVNRLSMAVALPLHFLHNYITNCIKSCQAAQEDKFVQTRRVRLVCVFLQSLIRNGILNAQDLFYEMQAFCIEFSRVREAALLFRLLKSLENGEKLEDTNNGPSSAS